MKMLLATTLMLACTLLPVCLNHTAAAQDPAAEKEATKAEQRKRQQFEELKQRIKQILAEQERAIAAQKAQQQKKGDGLPQRQPTQEEIIQKLDQLIQQAQPDSGVQSPQASTNDAPSINAANNRPVTISPAVVNFLARRVHERETEIARLRSEPATDDRGQTDKPPVVTNGSIPQKQFQDLLGRLDEVETELTRLNQNNPPPPAAGAQRKIQTLIDTPYIGLVYVGSNKYVRFFAARLIFDNPTAKPMTVKQADVELIADGKTYKLGEISPQVRSQSFTVGNQSFYLGNMKFPKEVQIPAGGTGSMWTAFSDLPTGNNVPVLSYRLRLAGRARALDVNEFCRGVLGLKVERIGPRGGLGLLTISGSMDMINIGSLVEELDKLTVEKVARVVIRWDKSAPYVESQIFSWLTQAAYRAGRPEQNTDNRFPIVSAAIRELHLAEVPSQNGSGPFYSPYGANAPRRIHKTDYEAASAALRSGYQILPRDELLEEIDNGHPLTRAAALEGGGGRLPSDRLPMILGYADSGDAHMQRAALIALRHFGEPQAIEKLVHYTRKGAEPLASVAIESLAGSRYSAAHQALLKVLGNEPPESKKRIVALIARYPRPIWGEAIYEYATSGNSQVSVAALRALAGIGHPKLREVLEDSLSEGNAAMRTEAFNILVARTDPRSEELAIRHTLKHLEKSPPTSQMLELLNRTKDRRAVPLLLKHFEASNSNRSSLINSLAIIGDQSVAESILKRYAVLKTYEKTAVLNMLRQLRSPKFRELAGEALYDKDSSLVSTACQGLQADGSGEAVELLVAAFEKTGNQTAWSYISNALYNLGTPEARAALVKGTKSKNAKKRNYAVNALRNLRQRSPGYQYIYMGQQFDRQKKWKEAIQQYSLAAQIDPQLPEAYAGRGNALLKQDKFTEAGKDFEQALQLDPFSSLSISGLGIVRVMDGKTDEGIKLVEDNRKEFENDALFAYNAACVYGRALQQVTQDEQAADRDKKIAQYGKKAVAELKRAVNLGFRDYDWMKKDPDLNSLHDLDEFKKIHTPAEAEGVNPGDARPAKKQPQPTLPSF